MENRDAISEACSKAAERLRRQRDLGHEDDRASTGGKGGRTRADVHLGLAAPGRTREQDVAASAREQALDPRECLFLRHGKLRRRRFCRQGGRGRHLAPFAATRRLVRGDERERSGRRRAVVVRDPEREVDERGRQRLEHPLGCNRLDVRRRLGVGVHHDAAAARVAEADREHRALLHLVRDLVRERPARARALTIG